MELEIQAHHVKANPEVLGKNVLITLVVQIETDKQEYPVQKKHKK